jgi:hypothetical protein
MGRALKAVTDLNARDDLTIVHVGRTAVLPCDRAQKLFRPRVRLPQRK